MGYSNYKNIKTVSKKFGIDVRMQNLFPSFKLVTASDWLLETLEIARIMPLNNEKTKSERIVSPILMEVVKAYQDAITLFSGQNIDVDSANDLAGPCDFFFALHPPKPFIEAPIISLTEAKDEDMEYGIGQCAAQMYGAKLFNDNEGKDISVLYGCATDGAEWQFIRFEDNTFYIDIKNYTDLKEILGVWHHIVQLYLKK